ncbi:MAG: L,D-transpeptidase [Flavipsychrobacter sp.]|nr:L,D-transpeptidase [Flavipsychrobacter sp.]
MPRILLRVCFRFLLCGIGIGLFSVHPASAQAPTDMKVLEEHRTANGDIVRTIQYTQGGRRVTETRTIKQFQPLTQPIDPDTLNRDSLLVVVSKSRFVLDVYYKRKKIRSYKVVFGPKPKENKMMKGDRCTPEGKFSVLNKHASARYDKFIQIDYPNDSSRVRFELLKKKGAIPANAEIGGDVGIHGIWKGGDEMIDMGVGWTDGCIAMKNKDIEELYRILDVGVKVFIRK